jgi:PAS domain S-box-containing protein
MAGDSAEGKIRDLAAKALRASAERFRIVYHTAPLAFVLWDRECRVTDWNDRAERIFGWSPEDVLGKNFFEFLIPQGARPQVKDVVKSLLRGEVEPEVVNENLTKSGKKILCQWHNSVLRDPQGEIVGAMSLGLDITEARRAELELRASRKGLRSLARHLHTIREEERGAIARVIHDELGQTLTGMKMDLYWLQRQLNEDQGLLVEKIGTTLKQIDETVKRVQKISTELRPGLLDDLGLVAAIEWQVEQFRVQTQIPCELVVAPRELFIEADLATIFFRILQEALTNVVRHAQADHVRVHLIGTRGQLELEVADDGCGIAAERLSDHRSFGLISMHERASSWGGEIEISGQADRGTVVRVTVPLPTEPAEA